MTKELFEEIVWPCMVPLFAKVEVKKEEEEDDEWKEKGRSPALLQLALVCFDKGLKEDFEFVKDVKQVVKMLLVRMANKYLKAVVNGGGVIRSCIAL